MIRTLIKLAAMLLSYFGWWEFFRGRCRVNVFFAPVLTLAFQFAVMFLPGLLNFLSEAAWALYFGGFLCLADALRREKLGFLRNYVNWGYALFAAAFAGMLLAFRDAEVTWFDNFTHWATVVKAMIRTDAFPTFAQEAVSFHTYPLGSATLIWYFSRITCDEENFWILSQCFMLLCTLLPLFSSGGKNSLVKAVLLAVAGWFLLWYNIPPTELLVDTLLPLAGAAMLLFVYRECMREEAPVDIRLALPVLLWVMNIKNAGSLYVIAAMLLLFRQHRKSGRELKPLLITALVLLSSWFLWERHCDYVYYPDSVSQHEISVEYFSGRLGEKTLGDVWTIAVLLVRAMVLRRELAVIVTALAVLTAAAWMLAPGKIRKLGSLGLFLAGSFVIYGISLLAMYVFSMSLEGAIELQSSDRYFRIWELTAWYLLIASGLWLADGLTGQTMLTLLLAVGMLGVRQVCYGDAQYPALLRERAPEDRERYESILLEYGVARGYSYLFCAEDDRYWYPAFLWGYHLDSGSICQIHVTDESQMEAEKYYDYVVILDEGNPIIEKWVRENYPDQAGRTVIQCFK